MSCVKNIRTDLAPTFPVGGTWVYQGYHASNPAGPFGANPANPIIPIIPSTLTGWGDNFNLDTDGVTAGFYKFQYVVGSLTFNLTVSVESDAVCAGSNNSTILETGDTLDLSTLLSSPTCASPASGGVWTDMDDAGAAFVAPNFTPVSTGVYRFKYSLYEPGFTVVTCDCSHEATITITVVDSLTADIVTSAGTCTYTMEFQNPNTDTVNNIELTVPTNAKAIVAAYNRVVEWCTGSHTVLKSFFSPTIGISLVTSQSLDTGGYIDHITVRTTTATTITIPLAPSTATYSGVGGVISASDLAFLPLNATAFANSIAIAIRNYLGTLGYTDGTHYQLIGVSYANTNRLSITFACKHSPTAFWLGISSADCEIEFLPNKASSVPVLDEDDWSPYAPALVVTDNYSNAPCPSGANQLTGSFAFSVMGQLDLLELDFNNIELANSTVNVVPTGTLTFNCQQTTLTATATGCGGTLSYLWSTGATSSSIVATPGSYSVTVTCSSPSDNDTANITI